MSDTLEPNWLEKLRHFCDDFNIPLEYLADTLYEPKVIPMIRGKAFEFSVYQRLQEILPANTFAVEKARQNPQFGIHDEDVSLTVMPTGQRISVECKLAGKGEFRTLKKNEGFSIRVKCMRSRMLGDTMVKRLSEITGIEESVIKIHRDSYLPSDFDLVVTSIGNAFYVTQDEQFIWQPNRQALHFLGLLSDGLPPEELKDFAYHSLFFAFSKDIAAMKDNLITCTRKKCPIPDLCGFVPNYPYIYFEPNHAQVQPPWYPIEVLPEILETHLG